jgi:hydrogenase expression/formation protein HypC
MQIVSYQGSYAVCRPYKDENSSHFRHINMQLVGELPIGTWVLTFLDSAREIISAEAAEQIHKALQALELVMQGEKQGTHQLEALFADLIQNEPQLPEHLRPNSSSSVPKCSPLKN